MHKATFLYQDGGFDRLYFRIGDHYSLCLQREGTNVKCYDCNNRMIEPEFEINQHRNKIYFEVEVKNETEVKEFLEYIDDCNYKALKEENRVCARKRLYDCMFGLSIDQQLNFIENSDSVSVCLKQYDSETIKEVVSEAKKELEAKK